MRVCLLVALLLLGSLCFVSGAPLPPDAREPAENKPEEVPVVESVEAVAHADEPVKAAVDDEGDEVPEEPDYDDYDEDEYGYGDEDDIYDDEDVDYDDYDDEDDEYYDDDDEGDEPMKIKRPAVDERRQARKEEFDSEYQRYLDEMMQAMMDDPNLSEEIVRDLEESGSRSPLSQRDRELYDMAKAMHKQGLRTELEEQERLLVERMRRTEKRKENLEEDIPVRAGDVSFGDKDENAFKNLDERSKKHLKNIVEKRVRLMGHIDEERRKAFVEHMMKRELEFREELAQLKDEDQRKERIRVHDEEWETLKNSKGNQPGHKQQLEDVWRAEDGMAGDLQPEVFFAIHDFNGDHQLDIKELEALFMREARNLHSVGGQEPDMDAVYEEMARMREAVMTEVDQDKDDMISRDEFLQLTALPQFEENESWKALFPEFTDEELKSFEERVQKALKHKHTEHVDHRVAEAVRRHEDDMIDRLSEKHKESADMLRSAKDLKQRHLAASLKKMKEKLGDAAGENAKVQHLEKMLERFNRKA
eukprot:m.56007 g.56007  ORF g.56007 m.56007 type:complete len:533 (+) comp13676_c1_seq1:46-1644(+)